MWRSRVEGLLNNMLTVFFPDGVAKEISCETADKMTCTTDMLSFKGYLHRWLAVTAQLAPFTKARIMATLRSSAAAAVRQCTGGASGRVCGFRWVQGAYDGTDGAGQEMNVLGALLSLLVDTAPGPYTSSQGGTSAGDPNAGGDGTLGAYFRPITAADRAGAGILTALLLGSLAATLLWMASPVFEGGSGKG